MKGAKQKIDKNHKICVVCDTVGPIAWCSAGFDTFDSWNEGGIR